jgi:hypothetical protein
MPPVFAERSNVPAPQSQLHAGSMRRPTSHGRDSNGKSDDAAGPPHRAMLSKIYNWFTERFDTTDLKEAKALLEQLQS